MAFNWRPVVTCLALVALLGWLLAATPGGPRNAAAEPSLSTPRLGGEFVAFHDEHDEEDEDWDDDYDEDEEDGEDEHDEDDEHEWEEHLKELEIEQLHLELRRAELQASFGELELMQEVTKIVQDPEATAVMAIVSTVEEIDDPDQTAEFLHACLERTRSDAVRRVVRLYLAEVYADKGEPGKAVEIVLELAEGK